MKFLISAVIVIGLILGAYHLHQYWETFQPKEAPAAAPAAVSPPGDNLPGLPPKLQPILDAARQRGAIGLHDFLAAYARNVADPRLASIQLDYVLLVAQSDPAEARLVFAKVKARIGPNSPVYSRVQQLEKTYE